MYESNNASEPTQPPTFAAAAPPKTSSLAIASFIMALLCLFTCVLWPILFLPAIICGIIALVKISGSNGALKGQWMAVTGIVIPALMIVIVPMLMAILMPALGKTKMIAQRVVCGTNLKGLGSALYVYALDYDDKLPTADVWCDVLMSEADVSPKSFICPSSDAVEGQSSYAINRSAAGKRLRDLPADMVLLFEVSPGPRRWNPSGGPESINTEHHDGCNILFADRSVQFVPADQLHTLRWTAD